MKLELQIINKDGNIKETLEYSDTLIAIDHLRRLTKSRVMSFCGYNNKQGFNREDTIEATLVVREDMYGEVPERSIIIASRTFQIVEI